MKLILRVILILFPFWCCAQTNSKSSLQDYKVATNFDSIAILSFIDSIETKYPVRFFYKQRWLNNIFVRQKQVPISLVGLLDDTFRGTNLHYIVDRSNILITSDYIINTTLPDDFFVIKNHPLTATDSIVLPYSFLHQNIKKENEDKTNVLVMGTLADKSVNNRVTISGIVKDDENGEPIVGAQVSVRGNEKGTVTDVFGHYTIVVLRGDNELHFKYFGKKEIVIPVVAYKDYSMNVNLSENLVLLKEVVVKADKENKVRNLNVGVQKLNIAEIKLLPKMLGETDIIKSALLLPGVQTVGEGSSGFNVRGGSADQNLILFDDAPVFNSSHLFGFFSAFNAETVKDFELYKCGIPARFGGRVSSVFDITARQGNLKKSV
jgi:TonB-dependent Receptor Plug Domain.